MRLWSGSKGLNLNSPVTVIIPCYNNVSTVLAAVRSAIYQQDVASKVIVVDDGSTDGSAEILLAEAGRFRLIRQDNKGACAARNRGLAETDTPFVKFLDADDLLMPNCLATQLSQAKWTSSEVVVFGRGRWETPSGDLIEEYPSIPMSEGTSLGLADLIDSSPLTSCPLHRRTLLEAVGGFDVDCPRGQEHDLHIRLGLIGAVFTFHDTVCYRYIQHNSESRISGRQRLRSVCAAQIEVYDRQLALAKQMRRLELRAGAHRLSFARHFWRHGRVCARAGHFDLASVCFDKSDAIVGVPAGGAVGSTLYKTLVRFFGGVSVEMLMRRSSTFS